jgi:hypothetical protein
MLSNYGSTGNALSAAVGGVRTNDAWRSRTGRQTPGRAVSASIQEGSSIGLAKGPGKKWSAQGS